MKNVSFPIDGRWKPWTYSLPAQTFTGAGAPATLSPRIIMDSTTWFVLTHVTGTITMASARLQFRRNTDAFSNQAIDSSLILGTGLRPYYLPAPIFAGPSQEFGIDITGASGAGVVRVQFHGVVVEGNRDAVKAGVGALATSNGFAEFYVYDLTRAYVANEREKMSQKITGDFDFLCNELNGVSTGTYDSQFTTTGSVTFDDSMVPNVGRFGNAQFPGYQQPWFMQGAITAIFENVDTSGVANTIEIALAGVRFPRAK